MVYYVSVVLKAISVCNILNHNTRHPTYMITYPVRDMPFIIISICLSPTTGKVGIYVTFNYVFFIRPVNYGACG